MTGQIAGYVRVSSTDQNPDRQLAAVGVVDELFTDRVSGRSRAGRPALTEMLRHLRRGDTVRVSSMDRLARSVVDLAQLVQEMTGRGVHVEFVTEHLTFDPGSEDPFATFQLHLLGRVAQLERSLIRERQREGIEIAKTKGVYAGRAANSTTLRSPPPTRWSRPVCQRPRSPETSVARAVCCTTHSLGEDRTRVLDRRKPSSRTLRRPLSAPAESGAEPLKHQYLD